VLNPDEIFGTRSCHSGFEGAVDDADNFMSCHLKIYEPSYFVDKSFSIIFWTVLSVLAGFVAFIRIRRRLHARHMFEKIERRRVRRRESIAPQNNAFRPESLVNKN
jgi:hypothetical protein